MSATKKKNTIRLHNQLTVAAHGDERVERRHAVEVEVRRAYREEEHPGEDRAEPDEAVPHYRGAAGGVVEHLGGDEKKRDAIGDGKRRSGGGGGAVAGSYGNQDETLSVVFPFKPGRLAPGVPAPFLAVCRAGATPVDAPMRGRAGYMGSTTLDDRAWAQVCRPSRLTSTCPRAVHT